MNPPYTKAEVNAASPKAPIDPKAVDTLVIRFHVALDDVVKGGSSESSRIDLATMFNFMCAAKERKPIDDQNMLDDTVAGLAKSYTRAENGQSFRLDGQTMSALREAVNSFEEVARGISARQFKRTVNYVHNQVQAGTGKKKG